ncbi:Zinc finger BED domain-containing protein 5 [Araneus ventricosus]|uniref:Zinc finger BED domain-containing protein 5 n=1 Tax=Araneus ventricosus TaxID=182803 RepID=A0A4Y2ASD0_ARAVE|nr:Zinc finger BED domain-containing protein 5 [Araneus ventricosus]
MDKRLKIGTLKRSASRTEIRTTDLAAMEITVDQQDDNHEVQRPTDWPVQELEENLLLCYPLTKRCTGEGIFNAIHGYFCENEIDWAKYCGVCTDGGKSVPGCYKGLRGRIKIVVPRVAWSHFCMHRQCLAAKPLPDSLKEVLNQSVKVVNFIKAN